MGILSVHRNLLSNCKSQLKLHLSPSTNSCFIRRFSSPSGLSSKAQSHNAPTGDLKSNKKLVFLVEHFHDESGTYYNSLESSSRFPPYKYSLISDENSWKNHHNLGNPFSGLGKYILASSCNNRMLFFLYNMSYPFDGDLKYLLLNPINGKLKILPPPGPQFTNAHGFGFDSVSEDYKLVRFPRYDFDYDIDEADSQVQLYSLETDSWKIIGFPSCGNPLEKPCVHVNGVYYWETIHRDRSRAIILSFDFANEEFSYEPYVPRPPKFDHSKKGFVDDFVLVEYNGSLAALIHSELGKTEKPFSFEVWGWNDESYWYERVPRTTIDVPGGVVKVVGLFQNDKLFLQGVCKGELMLFDLAKSTLENIGIRADPQKVNIFPFDASISIPFMGNK